MTMKQYRVWAKNKEGMVTENIYIGEGRAILTTSRTNLEQPNTFFYLSDDSTIIMQCTGLKDKNGKLIYEGDVVLFNEERIHVTWDKNFAKFNLKRIIAQYENQDHFYLSKYFKIIGNIYENPELLKKN